MTLGTGIFASTVLVLFVLGIYQLTVRKRWRTVGKILGAAVVLLGLIVFGIWGWVRYQDRPKVVEILDGVRLGMSPLEVKLAKGAPTTEGQIAFDDSKKEFRQGWLFKPSDVLDEKLVVIFYGATKDKLVANIVCQSDGYESLLGVSRYTAEQAILDKFGKPTGTSIHVDGLSKLISYRPYKVAFEITKGQVSELCISSTGEVTFTDEYKPEGKIADQK